MYVMTIKRECLVHSKLRKAATLKLRESKVVRTRGTENRLVLEERRECEGIVVGIRR